MGFALLKDFVGILTDQGVDCCELLLCSCTLLPAANQFTQQRNQSIGLFLMVVPIRLKSLLAF